MRKISAVIITLLLILVLLIGVEDLPPFGKISNPTNNILSRTYLEKTVEETGSLNIVTGIILDYRALDTLMEATVIFSGFIVITLLFKIR
jgi:multicomponent Na+:H+ antiporter subunit B